MATSSEIDDHVDHLRECYGDVPVETVRSELGPAAYERARELHDRGVSGAARVWVHRGDEALLVRENARPESCGVPGGLIDPGEFVDQAGEREVREETGIECAILEVEYVHRAERCDETDNGPSLEEIAVAFVAEYVAGEIQTDEEILEARWWNTLPENVHSSAGRIGEDRLGSSRWRSDVDNGIEESIVVQNRWKNHISEKSSHSGRKNRLI